MKILWDLFEIGVNCFQGFIMMYFPFKFLGGKYSEKFLKNHGLLFAAMYTLLISCLNSISAFEHFLALLYIALIFIYCVICLKGKILLKLFASVFPVVIGLVITALCLSCSSFIFKSEINEITMEKSFQRFITVTIAQLLILYLINLSISILGKRNSSIYQLSHGEWLLITTILLLSIVIGAFFILIAFDKISKTSLIYVIIGIISILVINIVSFYLIIDLGKKNLAVIENEKLKIKIAYNEQYIENADLEYNLIQKMRHDSKAMYQVLSDFISNGELDKAQDHLKKMTDIADNRIIFVNTENTFANSIINAKLTIAKSFDINATCMTIDSFVGIDDIDLCRLLSNMLDNAITATSAIKSDDKRITVNISEDIGTYTFIIRNTIEESVLKNNPHLLSTKKNKEISGLGTGIIRDIAEKYNGKCDFYEKENEFCCSVILNTDM